MCAAHRRAPRGGRAIPGSHREADGDERAHAAEATADGRVQLQRAPGASPADLRLFLPRRSKAGRLRGLLLARVRRAGDLLPGLQALDGEDATRVSRLAGLTRTAERARPARTRLSAGPRRSVAGLLRPAARN